MAPGFVEVAAVGKACTGKASAAPACGGLPLIPARRVCGVRVVAALARLGLVKSPSAWWGPAPRLPACGGKVVVVIARAACWEPALGASASREVLATAWPACRVGILVRAPACSASARRVTAWWARAGTVAWLGWAAAVPGC